MDSLSFALGDSSSLRVLPPRGRALLKGVGTVSHALGPPVHSASWKNVTPSACSAAYVPLAASLSCRAMSRRRRARLLQKKAAAAENSSGEPAASYAASIGDRVVVHYEGKTEDGRVFESTLSREPVVFAIGKGQVIKALDEAVSGLSVGDKVSVTAPPSMAYGERRDENVIQLPASPESKDTSVGDVLILRNNQGKSIDAKVLEVGEDYVKCDVNHHLAGQTLTFNVELIGIRPPCAPARAPPDCEQITFAAGNFWSAELLFQRVEGVIGTCVGYTQGHVPKPTFQEVGGGKTGHAMAVRVIYDQKIVQFETLLSHFWEHLGYNATTFGVFGDDSGEMFRSGIYFDTEAQKCQAEKSVLEKQIQLRRPVVTEVQAASPDFWLAEDKHQGYLAAKGQSNAKCCTDEIMPYG